MSNSNKKGKSVARSHSNVGSLKEAASGSSSEAGANMEDNQGQISFENTPFGQLLGKIKSRYLLLKMKVQNEFFFHFN